ncbi:MAG: clostripain-related cysteine peptidase, partial [Candidatus Sericytochromatia bacterium]
KKTKAFTFLTYKALDNNLGVTLSEHMNVLERAGSSTHVNALAFTDDIGPKNTHMYYVRKDGDRQSITSPYAMASDRDLNTGSWTTLRKAIKWGFSEYPGRLRWLDVNNHGGGYYGIAQDDKSDRIIRLPELAKALKQGAGKSKLDVVSFDACLMATAEVAYEIKDSAKIMVASEDSSYALGMNYDQTLAALASKPNTDADDLARDLVLRSQRKGKIKALYTISALDLSRAEVTTKAVDQLSRALIKALPANRKAIMMSLAAVKPFYVAGPDKSDFNHRDLNEVADQLRQRVPDRDVVNACLAVKKTLFNRGGLVLLSRATSEQNGVARGVSIYLPTDGKVDPIYKSTAFAKATQWDEFLAAL